MIINKSLILTFDKYIMLDDKPKVGINYLSLVFTRGKNLIPCFLAFWSTSGRFNPYLPFKFLIFYHSC